MANKERADLQVLTNGYNAPKTSRWVIISWLSLIIALLAIAGSIYAFIINNNLKKEQLKFLQSLATLQQSFALYKSETVQLPDNLTTLLQDLTNQLKTQKSDTKEIESLIVSDLNPKINFLLKEFDIIAEKQSATDEQRDDNTLELVIKVLKYAELYLSVLHDVKMANNLLAFAEQVLINQNGAIYVQLKDSIAKDRQAIAAIAMPDKEKIWQILDELSANVPQYVYKCAMATPTIQVTPEHAYPDKPDDNVADVSMNKPTVQDLTQGKTDKIKMIAGWKSSLKNSWHELRSLIKVKRNSNYEINNKTDLAFVNLTEQMSRVRLQISIEQVRIATFEGNNTAYRNSLTTIKNIFTQYFVPTHELTQRAVDSLDLLANINIMPELPSHLDSFVKLEAILQSASEAMPQ